MGQQARGAKVGSVMNRCSCGTLVVGTTALSLVMAIPAQIGFAQPAGQPVDTLKTFMDQQIGGRQVDVSYGFVEVAHLGSKPSKAGRSFGTAIASTSGEIDAVFARTANEKRVQGLLVHNSPLFIAARVQLAILAARFAVPAIYPSREHVEAGGLLSYGANLTDMDREVGRYVGRILKGEKPADLPVMQPTQFELVVNLNTARALGLTVPPTLLALATEVIE